MLSIILVRLKPAFSRWTKSKKLPFKLDKHATPVSLKQAKQSAPHLINKQMKTKHQVLKQQINKLVDSGLTEQQILTRYIKTNTKSIKIQKVKDTQQAVDLVKQDLILNQIMKNYKNKKTQLPIGSKYESQKISQSQKQAKKQRIFNKIQTHLNTQQNMLSNISFEDQLRQKYSQDIIAKAEQKRIEQLSYFKDLMKTDVIKQHDDQRSLPLMDRRLRKNETYSDLIQRDRKQLQKIKKQNKQVFEKTKQLKQLSEEQKKLNKPVSQQLVEFENEDYYKQKAIKQFTKREGLKKQDRQIKQAGQRDADQAADAHSIIIDEYEAEHQAQSQAKKELYLRSSFGRMDAKMLDMQNRLKKHGISLDMEQLIGMKKDMLFAEKKQREQIQQYQKYLMKKQKKEKMKQYFKKIHSEKLREDLDFNVDFKKRFDDFQYDPLDIEANIEKMKQINLQRQATVMPNDVKSQIHFKKTQKNIQKAIRGYIFKDIYGNPNELGEFMLKQIKYNQKKTVVHIFWGLRNQQNQIDENKIKQIGKKLEKSSTYISGKLAQLLGLRYGPEVRFYFDRLFKQTLETKRELQKSKEEVVEFQIKNLVKKGHIKTQQQLADAKYKLQMIAKENLKNYNNRNKILSKSYRKRQKMQTPQQIVTNVKKSKKKSADERLWEHIDKL